MGLITKPIKVHISPNTYANIREYIRSFLVEAQNQLNNLINDIQDQADSGAFDGPQGPKGDPFTYEDFTPQQLASLGNTMIINATQQYYDWDATYGDITFDKTFNEIIAHLKNGGHAVVNFIDPDGEDSGTIYHAMEWFDVSNTNYIGFYELRSYEDTNSGSYDDIRILTLNNNNTVQSSHHRNYNSSTIVEFTLDSSTGYLRANYGQSSIAGMVYDGAVIYGKYEGILYNISYVTPKNQYSGYAYFTSLKLLNTGELISKTISPVPNNIYYWQLTETSLNNLASGSY